MIYHSANSRLVIVIDDDKPCLDSMKMFLTGKNFIPSVFETYEGAFSFMKIAQGPVLCVLLDLHLRRGPSGRDCIDSIQRLAPDLPIVIMTGDTSPAAASLTQVTGQPVLVKPFSPAEFEGVIEAIRRG